MQQPLDSAVRSTTAPRRGDSGKFRNPWAGGAPHGFGDVLKWVLDRRRTRTKRRSEQLPAAATPSFDYPRAAPGELTITWVGHSTFLLQIGGANVLLDPIWSNRASPVSFAGPRRLTAPGVAFDALPPIDLVLLSHDHYDHLDRDTVRRLVAQHPQADWMAPLGVGEWLRRRGARVVAELDWWASAQSHGLDVTCTPAQHFSGRRFDNRDSTLWCGWVIRAGARAVFFAGDTGRHPEFGAITSRLGPFDAAFMPIGAYDPRWFMGPVHVAPDDAVSAYRDIADANSGKPVAFVAMHWGTFRLTDEPMDEPPRLTRAAWDEAGLDPAQLKVMAPGETVRSP